VSWHLSPHFGRNLSDYSTHYDVYTLQLLRLSMCDLQKLISLRENSVINILHNCNRCKIEGRISLTTQVVIIIINLGLNARCSLTPLPLPQCFVCLFSETVIPVKPSKIPKLQNSPLSPHQSVLSRVAHLLKAICRCQLVNSGR